MAADPVSQSSRADTYWTTVNATEALPGRTTPLTWTFYSDATELALRGSFAEMGVLSKRDVVIPDDGDERFIGIFFAHPAANLNRFRLAADLSPGSSGDALERQFFGTVRTGAASHKSRRRYPAVAVRMPVALARVGGRVRRARDRTHAWWLDAVRGDPDRDRDRRLLAEAVEQYRRVLHWHGLGTMLTQGIYDQLAQICTEAGMEHHENAIVAGVEGLDETEVVADLWDLSRGRLSIETVVARHGFHGPEEGELATTVWRERPELLDAVVGALAAMPDDESPRRKCEQSAADAREAATALRRSLGPAARGRASALTALARRLMPLREVGRGAMVRTFDVGRCAARRLGDSLVAEGALADRDDVFFLTVGELTAAAPPAEAGELVSERRARHLRYLEIELPDGWWGEPEPIETEVDPATAELEGTAASPGVVEGIAKVVASSEGSEQVNPGEVLVCHTTDPGWAPLMHAASGLAIDVGGPLSHGAIVARELGIPCVIGTGEGTRVIRSGDRVEVDGGAGRVRVLERIVSA